MPFEVEDPNKPGEMIQVHTADELAERDAATAAELAASKSEIEKLQRVSAEKTENFKKLNEMTEEERAAFSAKEIENMKRVEAAEAKAAALEATMNQSTQERIKSDTDAALFKYHGGDEKLKAALEANFKVINLEGTDTATLNERARLSAAMEAGKTGNRNPLYAPMSGGSPRVVEKSKTEEFMKSEKAAEALKRMGD